jgi:hypothetical protein
VSSVQCVALVLILSSLVGAIPAARAQAQTPGEVTGQVLDSFKPVIFNAAVTVTTARPNPFARQKPTAKGHYALTNLLVGHTHHWEHEGFQLLKQPVVMLSPSR